MVRILISRIYLSGDEILGETQDQGGSESLTLVKHSPIYLKLSALFSCAPIALRKPTLGTPDPGSPGRPARPRPGPLSREGPPGYRVRGKTVGRGGPPWGFSGTPLEAPGSHWGLWVPDPGPTPGIPEGPPGPVGPVALGSQGGTPEMLSAMRSISSTPKFGFKGGQIPGEPGSRDTLVTNLRPRKGRPRKPVGS